MRPRGRMPATLGFPRGSSALSVLVAGPSSVAPGFRGRHWAIAAHTMAALLAPDSPEA